MANAANPAHDLEAGRRELEQLLARDAAAEAARTAGRFDELAGPLAPRIVLHGAGNLGVKVAEGLRRNGVEPLAFSDTNPASQGKVRGGLTVLSPEDAAARYGRSATFVPSIWNYRVRYPEVLAQLRSLGCERVVPIQALFCKYPATFLPYYHIDLPEKILGAAPGVRTAFGLLRDAESRREFLQMLRWSLDLEFAGPSPNPPEDHYFPADLRTLSPEEELLDVGAFDGDTLAEFNARTGGVFRRAVAFEPDPANWARLEARVAGFPESVRNRIELHREASGEGRGRLSFQSDGSSSSAVAPGSASDLVVDVAPLDDHLDLRPTLLKMDIEGMEQSALRGARRIIREHAPALAICVYHRLADVWEIPLAIEAIRPGYALYLRRYSEWPWEIVCYAIPSAS